MTSGNLIGPLRLTVLALACATTALMADTGVRKTSADAHSIPKATSWIGPARSEVNQWTRFRKTFTLTDKPSVAKARIAVDSKYWLWLNGAPVVREGGLKRGPAPDGTYFDVVDLSPHLKPGGNTIALLLWHFGKDGFSHNSSGRAGLLFHLDLPGQTIVSDSSWKLSPHPSFSTSPDTPPNRRLPESSILFDARNDDPEWTGATFDCSAWSPPAIFGKAFAMPWGALTERPIPLWKDFGLREYPSVSKIQEGAAGTITARLPYNAQVNPWMRIEARAGLEIDIRTDNFMGGSEPNVHAKFITREGVQEFECPGWMNGHEVLYQIPEGVRVLDLKYRETGYDTEFTGSFECDDPDLNLLWKKAARTLYVTMRDTYMDCPDRERSQWWGDVVNELGEVPYVFDPRAHQLTRKAIHELVDWQRPDGTLFSPVPAGIPEKGKNNDGGTWSTELPVQMLASIGKYGFWTYYLQTGDKETIAHAYPAVASYLNLWKLDRDNLVVHRPGDWDWSDWGDNIDARILDSAWYQLALEGAVAMAGVSGNTADIPRWESLRSRIASGFNRVFWTGTEYRSPGYKGDTDDRANALAVLAGFAKPDQYPALREVLTDHRNASPWMEKYVIEALYLMDAPDLAMSRMKERYRAQIDSHLTTLWEGWGIGSEGYGGGSYNHAWSGGPLTCLSQFAAGIAPISPGFATYAILPQMGSLRHVTARVDSPAGMIEADLKRTESSFTASLVSPPGASGRIGIPKRSSGSPKFLIAENPARPDSENERFHFFRIPSGRSTIKAEW
jgi:alpha-L-rhamnosidase